MGVFVIQELFWDHNSNTYEKPGEMTGLPVVICTSKKIAEKRCAELERTKGIQNNNYENFSCYLEICDNEEQYYIDLHKKHGIEWLGKWTFLTTSFEKLPKSFIEELKLYKQLHSYTIIEVEDVNFEMATEDMETWNSPSHP